MTFYFQKLKSLYRKSLHIGTDIKELLWAEHFHDYINSMEEIKKLQLAPRGWAANYSMLFIITKIINEFKPGKILEFGLGESSKLISTLINNLDEIENHLIIESDSDWIDHFKNNFELLQKSKIVKTPAFLHEIKKQQTLMYDLPKTNVYCDFELFIIDGPKGSRNFSRFNICEIADNFKTDKEFIIIIDDAERNGEIQTITELQKILNKNKIIFDKNTFTGCKTQYVIATEKYKYALSL